MKFSKAHLALVQQYEAAGYMAYEWQTNLTKLVNGLNEVTIKGTKVKREKR